MAKSLMTQLRHAATTTAVGIQCQRLRAGASVRSMLPVERNG
jgi:hypothetical protein